MCNKYGMPLCLLLILAANSEYNFCVYLSFIQNTNNFSNLRETVFINRENGIVFPESTAYESRVFMADTFQERTTPGLDPYFDTTVQSNIISLAGETVQLACRVKNLGNRTVSLKYISFLQSKFL